MQPQNSLQTLKWYTREALTFSVLLATLFFAESLPGQASLAAEDKIDEIQVQINGVQESFTVIRDARIEEQWYYMPDRPRLFERTVNGKTEPEFALIRYQFINPKAQQQLLEGGLLQFAASLALPPEAMPQLETAIRAKVRGKSAIRLAAMPFKSATVSLYTPGEGDLIAAAPQGAGIAPTFATQKMAFSVPLTRIGSDVYDELTNGNTGMPVIVEFEYNGLTPPAGFRIEVDWDQIHKFYSKDQKFAASASYAGLYGGSTEIDHRRIRETLEENKCIKVLITQGETFTQDQIDKHLEPVLNRINQELVERIKPPEKIPPSEAATPKSSGRFLSAGYSVAIKNVAQVKKGREVFDLNVRQHQTRKTVASGFVGIGRYPQELKDRLVTIVPEGPWRSAFFVLPAVGDGDELGISQVDLEIGLTDGKDVSQSQVVAWTPEGGWRDRNGEPRTVLTFALMGREAAGFDSSKAEFTSKAKITVRREVLEVQQRYKVFNGETAITTPLSGVEVVAVDGSVLSWARVEDSSPLVAVNVLVQTGSRRFTGRLKPRRVDAEWMEPLPLYWLLPKETDQVKAEVKFLLDDGRQMNWKHNGKDLLRELSSLEITLVDGDWQDPER